MPAFTAEQIYPCLLRTFERRGLPEAMLMDYAAVCWGTMNTYGLMWLWTRLIQHGIRLMSGRMRHPQTQGKVRCHRTLDEAIRHRGRPNHIAEAPGALDESRLVYTGLRPHEALGMEAPRQRCRVSARSYQRQVQEWGIRKEAKCAPDPGLISGLVGRTLAFVPDAAVRRERVAELLLVSLPGCVCADRPEEATHQLVVLPRGADSARTQPGGQRESPASSQNQAQSTRLRELVAKSDRMSRHTVSCTS